VGLAGVLVAREGERFGVVVVLSLCRWIITKIRIETVLNLQ
jgi:hypothetical protein